MQKRQFISLKNYTSIKPNEKRENRMKVKDDIELYSPNIELKKDKIYIIIL